MNFLKSLVAGVALFVAGLFAGQPKADAADVFVNARGTVVRVNSGRFVRQRVVVRQGLLGRRVVVRQRVVPSVVVLDRSSVFSLRVFGVGGVNRVGVFSLVPVRRAVVIDSFGVPVVIDAFDVCR